MSEKIKNKLLEMISLDQDVRSKLVNTGELFNGYHPEMEKVHNQNALKLDEIIDQEGWPSVEMVGEKASEAAWLIVQHAISKPYFQKKCLKILKQKIKESSEELKWIAFLEDRINVFQGKQQIYGTQFDWDQQGLLSPYPIKDEENVDLRRAKIGLVPLKDRIRKIRANAQLENNTAPKDHKKRQEQFVAWAKKVGWRE